MMQHRLGPVGFGVGACVLAAGSALGQAPNVKLQDIPDTTTYGVVGTIRAYAIGSDTCNVGNGNMLWTNGGTPALAMNAYRLHGGRLEQIGQGWCKHACCAAAGNGCGASCNGVGGNQLGAGCLDVYGAGFNGGQFGLGPRSGINPYAGNFAPISGTSGTAIAKRLQVQVADLSAAGFPGALYFVEGVYAASDEPPAQQLDNATYKRTTVAANGNLTLAGAARVGVPAIYAWREHGLGVGAVDARVNVFTVDAPGEGRYHVGYKVTDLGGNSWRYDYAIFNLNSDVAAGSFSLPVRAGDITDRGFKDVPYHSGEPYDNADWVAEDTANSISWRSPQTFAQNPNSNALRWGTMYNFWFTSSRPPADGQATMGFFKAINPGSVQFTVSLPGGCAADFNGEDGVTVQDLFDFLGMYFGGRIEADWDNSNTVTVQDIFAYLEDFFTPCE